MTDDATHTVFVKAHIWRTGHLLLLKRRPDDDLYPDLWDIPGGRLDRNESARAGLAREIAEETGLILQSCRPLTVWDFDNQGTRALGLSFLATCNEAAPRISGEHEKLAWMAPQDLDRFPMAPNLQQEIAWIISKGWHR